MIYPNGLSVPEYLKFNIRLGAFNTGLSRAPRFKDNRYEMNVWALQSPEGTSML